MKAAVFRYETDLAEKAKKDPKLVYSYDRSNQDQRWIVYWG